MRLKKGSQIEVLNKSEDPAGSWWCAKIVSGNGHNYNVRYDRNQLDVDSSLESVPRKVIRPFPPIERARLGWIPGDIVEVLDNFSWITAKIRMFYSGQKFSVRLLSSSKELIVPSSGIRLRKCWQDNKWVDCGKDFAVLCDKPTNGLSKPKKNVHVEDTLQNFAINVKKRARTCSRPVEEFAGANKKMRTSKNEDLLQGAFARNSTSKKIDYVAPPQTLFGEKYMNSSLINRNNGTFETNQFVERGHCSRFIQEGNDVESISSSVGSCGVNKSPCRSTFHPFNGTDQDMESQHVFLEASPVSARETTIKRNDASHQDIHSLELQAYHSTMLALRANASISWEQEALLTNLRLMLHISIDEHIAEINSILLHKAIPMS